MKDIFTKEYVDFIMKPFIGKELRMCRESINGVFTIPFLLEPSMESTIKIDVNTFGIKFTLRDNYYLKKELHESMVKGIKNTDISLMKLNDLAVTDGDPIGDFFGLLVDKMMESFAPQVAFTYYTMIESLEVHSGYFVLNGIKFIVCK